MARDFDGFMDDWFEWITLWRKILTIPEIQQILRDRESDKQSPRKLLTHSDTMLICVFLTSTRATVSIGKLAKAIATDKSKDARKRERQRITSKVHTLADYGLLDVIPKGKKDPQYFVSASDLLLQVLQKLHEQRNGD